MITRDSTGTLTATGGAYGAAGIGGRAGLNLSGSTEKYATGTIVIEGGDIQATGGAYWLPGLLEHMGGAGIGTGLYGIGGSVTIEGGKVVAEGGRNTAAGIGGGEAGAVDSIQIGGSNGKRPYVKASSYKEDGNRYGAGIGSGYNSTSGLNLPCGEIKILSGHVIAEGNIGHGGFSSWDGNAQGTGSVDIAKDVELELTEGTITPRGKCTFGKKVFQITAYVISCQMENIQQM